VLLEYTSFGSCGRAVGRDYSPAVIVIETAVTHWVVETKMDKEVTSAYVNGEPMLRAAGQATLQPVRWLMWNGDIYPCRSSMWMQHVKWDFGWMGHRHELWS
jgi:hypothetical protein